MGWTLRAAFLLVAVLSAFVGAIAPALAEQDVRSPRGYRLVVPDGWLVRNLDSTDATLAAPEGAALPVRCVVRVVRDRRNFPMADSPEGFRRFDWRGWLERFTAREGLRVVTAELAPNQPLHLAVLTVDPSVAGGRELSVVHAATVRVDTLYSLSCFVPTPQHAQATATLNAIINSFAVSGPPGAPPRAETTVCPSELNLVREPETPFTCTCSAEHTRSGTVWGTDTYTADSQICPAALHAGVIGAEGGTVRLQRAAGLTAYPGSQRNSIESQSYGAYSASLRFLDATTAASPTAPPPAATPSAPQAAQAQAAPPSAPAPALTPAPGAATPAGTTQRASCPETGQGLQQPIECLCTAAQAQSGRSIWGTDIYTDDSNICGAALHASAIGRQGGAVRVTPMPGQQAYPASERNGVVSSPYPRWERSFGVASIADGAGQPPAGSAGGKPADPTDPRDRALCGASGTSEQSHRDRVAACTRLIEAGVTGSVLRDAHNGRGLSARALRQSEPAVQDFSRAIDLDPRFVPGYFNRALVHAEAGRGEDALRDLGRAIELAPNQPRPHVERAFLLAAMGEHEQALRGFARTLELDPHAGNAYYGRGLVLTALSRYEEAGRDFDRALEIQPDAPPVLVARAFNSLALGRREAALADFERDVSLSNRAPASLMNRAAGWLLLRESGAAMADYERVVAVAASDGVTHALRCFALAMLGRAAEGFAACDEAVRLRPNDADPLRSRAYALLRLGRFDAALADYDRAVALAPYSGTGLYGRAVVRTRAGDSAGAAHDRDAALRLDPQVQRRPAWVWLDYDPRSGAPAPTPPTLAPSAAAPIPAPAPAK